MPRKSITYYPKRVWTLGLSGLARQVTSRIRKKVFAFRYASFPGHTWEHIAKKHHFSHDFSAFFEELAANDFVETIRNSSNFIQHLPQPYHNKALILEQASNACNNCFDLFGSGKTYFQENQIPWQTDFRHEKLFKHATGYKPDIKVPWELSRFQHLYFLGLSIQFASQITRDERQKITKPSKYVETFQFHISDWLAKNQFLFGVNWQNPMEVSLRAINWIWGFSFFKNSPEISHEFWEKFVCSLYDHMLFIENNWEVSDKPNNHLICDLVGHLYLATFFGFEKLTHKTLKKILSLFDQQISPDGTSYEGSTAYHKLDTELFWHVSLLCEAQNIPLSKAFHEKLKDMFDFLAAVTLENGELVQIGDNDSGKVVTGVGGPSTLRGDPSRRFSNENPSGRAGFFRAVRPEPVEGLPDRARTAHYPNFGLSIIRIRTNRLHLTFRHASFTPNQPTGHFHNDHLAITLAVDGQPVLIDPGSYLYTANPTMRNQMRSFANHNTFYTQQELKNEFDNDLFQLQRHTHQTPPLIQQTDRLIKIESSYKERKRKIVYDAHAKSFSVIDTIAHPPFVSSARRSRQAKTGVSRNSNGDSPSFYSWNLVFHPSVELIPVDIKTWFIRRGGKDILRLQTHLAFTQHDDFYSPAYGVIQSTKKLAAQTPIKTNMLNCCLSFSICVT